MFAIKEAVLAQEHNPGLRSTIFFMDMRAFGKEFDDYYIKAAEDHKVRFVSNNRISSIKENPETHNLILTYIEDGELKEEEFDLVVLSVGMDNPEDAKELSEKLGFELNDFDFCETSIFSPESTNRPGIYVSGVFQGPKDIPDSVAQASGAAALAQGVIGEKRDTLTTVKEYPQEKEVEGEEPKIGAFICECGINIGGVVDVPDVVEYVKTLPNVTHAEHNMYTCSQDTQEHIKEMIKEHDLNRIMVASCTPRTHQPLFQNTVAEAGLNPYLFEMANIRDQCSWVHFNEPEKATQKAKDLVRMGLAKTKLNSPLPKIPIEVKQSALVLGGGISGLYASLELADQGYETTLVEKENELGGIVRKLHFGLKGEDIQKFLQETIENVESTDKITVYKNAKVTDVSGHVGNFISTIHQDGEGKKVEHGVIILATGGKEYEPTEYMYKKSDRVLTQLELDNLLFEDTLDPDTRAMVMVQCVGCRDENRTYCSRVCCTQAVKNALKVKEKNPQIAVYVLFRDMRTYSFREIYYEDAARSGVVFIRYDDESKPRVKENNGLEVVAYDPFLDEEILLNADYVVLSAATVPNPDNSELAHLLKVPLSKDGFFLEAHMKLRPVEFATDGIFLCGLAHSPKFFNECISQSNAAVSRALTILSKERLFVEATISSVNQDLCTGCGTCEMVCAFGAVSVDITENKAKVTEVLCKGCGTCAAACPEKAMDIAHFSDIQLLSQAIAALKEGIE
jgi:heterodisulfide reductase subunit A